MTTAVETKADAKKPATNIGKVRVVNPTPAKKPAGPVGPTRETKTQAEIDSLKAELKAKQDALKLAKRQASSSGKMERFVKYEADTAQWLAKATKAFQDATTRHDYALTRLNEYKASLQAPKAKAD